MGNTSIRAAASFCNENTLVKVYRHNPKYDRFETTFVPFKDIRKSDSVSVFASDGHELHFSVLTNASFKKDERYGNECGWSVKVTEDGGKTVMVLHPADFAPYIISLSVTDEGEWRGCRLLFESVLNDTEAIVNNMRARFEPRVAPENTCGRHSDTVAAMAERDLTREWTEQFGFRLISDSVNFAQCGVKDILSDKFFNPPAMELTFFAYSDGEYAASPLFFAKLPDLGERYNKPDGRAAIAELLQKLDEMYGDLPEDTAKWALEYQLWARMLLAEGAVMLNPKHLDIFDCTYEFKTLAFGNKMLKDSGDGIAWAKAVKTPISVISEAWENDMSESGDEAFTCIVTG